MVIYEKHTWSYSRKRIQLGKGVLIELLKYKMSEQCAQQLKLSKPHQFLLIIHKQKQANVTLYLNQVN